MATATTWMLVCLVLSVCVGYVSSGPTHTHGNVIPHGTPDNPGIRTPHGIRKRGLPRPTDFLTLVTQQRETRAIRSAQTSPPETSSPTIPSAARAAPDTSPTLPYENYFAPAGESVSFTIPPTTGVPGGPGVVCGPPGPRRPTSKNGSHGLSVGVSGGGAGCSPTVLPTTDTNGTLDGASTSPTTSHPTTRPPTVDPSTHSATNPPSVNPLTTDLHTAHTPCEDCGVCEGRSEGLVRYPTTLAPASGSVTVTVQCADNAHTTNYTRPNVTCTSNGSWSGQIPQCKCDDGYREVTLNGTQICQGINLVTANAYLSAVISAPAVSLLLILFIITTTFTLFLCRMKFKKKAAKDVEASNERKSSTNCEKVQEKQKDANEAYAVCRHEQRV